MRILPSFGARCGIGSQAIARGAREHRHGRGVRNASIGRVETLHYEPLTEDYFAYVIDAIKLGLEQVERGQTIPHEEVAKCMRQRWQSTTASTLAR